MESPVIIYAQDTLPTTQNDENKLAIREKK